MYELGIGDVFGARGVPAERRGDQILGSGRVSWPSGRYSFLIGRTMYWLRSMNIGTQQNPRGPTY